MTTTLRQLGARVSADLDALVRTAGPPNAATRALLILGAAAVGYEVRSLQREIAALLATPLAAPVHQALANLFRTVSEPQGASTSVSISASTSSDGDAVTASAESEDDPFAVGFRF